MSWSLVEIIVIAALILLQFFLAYEVLLKIKKLKSVFSNIDDAIVLIGEVPVSISRTYREDVINKYLINEEEIDPNEDSIEITFVSFEPENKIEHKIKNNINEYLFKNKGAIADFHLLKDIVTRNIDALDEEINNGLSAPLYLGLAATMFGIIFGLMRIPEFNVTNLDLNILMPLLSGVKYAMVASIIGLILTTILSVGFYKSGKSKSEEHKNDFLSFLQVYLLPEIVRTESSGITALNDRLSRFSRSLGPAIENLKKIVENSVQAVDKQSQIIEKVNQLDAVKLVEKNIDIFNNLQKLMDSFKAFAIYYQELNKSLQKTTELSNNLNGLVSRTIEVESIAKGIDKTLVQSEKLNQFLAQHFIDIESREYALKTVVDASERSLSKSFDAMQEAVKNKITEVQEITIKMEPLLKNAFASSLEAVDRMTEVQVANLERAYESTRPKFEKLEKLDQIDTNLATFISQNNQQQDSIIACLKDLSITLKEKNPNTFEGSNEPFRNNSLPQPNPGNTEFKILVEELRDLNGNLRHSSIQQKKKNLITKSVNILTIICLLSAIGLISYLIWSGVLN